MSQIPMFYEDIDDAIAKAVNTNPKGLNIKQIAMDLWPARNPDTARAAFSRAITPENNDVHLAPEEVVKTMEITEAPEHVIFYLCDRFGFERPKKKDTKTFEKAIKDEMHGLMESFKGIQYQIESLEKMRGAR